VIETLWGDSTGPGRGATACGRRGQCGQCQVPLTPTIRASFTASLPTTTTGRTARSNGPNYQAVRDPDAPRDGCDLPSPGFPNHARRCRDHRIRGPYRNPCRTGVPDHERDRTGSHNAWLSVPDAGTAPRNSAGRWPVLTPLTWINARLTRSDADYVCSRQKMAPPQTGGMFFLAGNVPWIEFGVCEAARKEDSGHVTVTGESARRNAGYASAAPASAPG
jgi:hypothetical protein